MHFSVKTVRGFQTFARSSVRNIYVTRLRRDGSGLIFSAHVGGDGCDLGLSFAVESDDSAVSTMFDFGWKIGARASGDMTDMSAVFLSALKGWSARKIPAETCATENR